MPEYLYPGVYVDEVPSGVNPIPGVSTSLDPAALASIAVELRRTAQSHAPLWTDRNEADPGVTLVELFAFLAESLLVRADEMPERGRVAARRAALALTALGRGPATGGGLQRPHYFSGRLLDAATLAEEQSYQREKQRRHNRELHGYGVVWGLAVRVEPSGSGGSRILVEPGYAIDPSGEEISVPRGAELAAPPDGDVLFVTLRYWERLCDPTPGGPSRVEEACIVGFGCSAAAPELPLARLLREGAGWRVDPSFAPPRAQNKP